MKLIKLLLFFLFTFQSCFLFESCPDTLPHFRINELKTQNVKFTGKGQEPWELVSNQDVVEWEKYILRVNFITTYIAKKTSFSSSNLYALDCISNGYFGTKSGIDTLYFVTQNDYNNSYVKNDTINNIVLMGYWANTLEQFDDFIPIPMYIDINRESISIDRFEIKLTESPNNTEQFFKIIVLLKDGQRFEVVSDIVSLI